MGATSLLNNYRFSRPNNLSKYYKYLEEIKKVKIQEYFEKNGKKEINFDKLEMYLMGKLRTSNGIDLNFFDIKTKKLI